MGRPPRFSAGTLPTAVHLAQDSLPGQALVAAVSRSVRAHHNTIPALWLSVQNEHSFEVCNSSCFSPKTSTNI